MGPSKLLLEMATSEFGVCRDRKILTETLQHLRTNDDSNKLQVQTMVAFKKVPITLGNPKPYIYI